MLSAKRVWAAAIVVGLASSLAGFGAARFKLTPIAPNIENVAAFENGSVDTALSVMTNTQEIIDDFKSPASETHDLRETMTNDTASNSDSVGNDETL